MPNPLFSAELLMLDVRALMHKLWIIKLGSEGIKKLF
jgi:hypothetical protein